MMEALYLLRVRTMDEAIQNIMVLFLVGLPMLSANTLCSLRTAYFRVPLCGRKWLSDRVAEVE